MPIHPPSGRGPYSHVKTHIDVTKAQITGLLRDYGCEGVSWSEDFRDGRVELRFAVTDKQGRGTAYRVRPAPFTDKHKSWDPEKGKSVQIESPNWPRALRQLYHWTKVKLESVAFGLTSIEDEFLSQMIIRDAEGHETTVGELVRPALEASGGRLAISPPKTREGAVDAEFEPR